MTRARRAAQLALSSLVLMTGCPADDDGETDTDATSNPTAPMTATMTATMTAATDATDATSEPTTGEGETGEMTTTGGVGAVDYVLDIQPIWDEKCVTSCHTPGGIAMMGPLLGADVSYANLVDKQSPTVALMLVAPGDPDGSYLWHKVEGTQADVPNGGGAKMPIGPALTDAELDLIEQWIAAGALP